MENKKKILLITTGGTIASKKTEQGLVPALSSNEIIDQLPFISGLCMLGAYNLCNIDSTNMTWRYWMMIAEAIEQKYDEYDGFVICHGTDTMAYTSAFLSYFIQNSKKPIVLTGSQQPISREITDAKMNLRDSILYALDEHSHGVCLVFGGKIISGTRAKKTRTVSFDAFSSINYPALAVMQNGRLVRYIPPENYRDEVRFYHKCNPKVFVWKLTPGTMPHIADIIFEQYDCIIVESFGVGGIPDTLLQKFSECMERYSSGKKVVVITTQVIKEGSNIGVYQVGRRIKERFEVLEAYDMNLEAVVGKMMWIMGQCPKSFAEIQSNFYRTINYDISWASEPGTAEAGLK